jgi:hypothetical protein
MAKTIKILVLVSAVVNISRHNITLSEKDKFTVIKKEEEEK